MATDRPEPKIINLGDAMRSDELRKARARTEAWEEENADGN